MAHKYSNEEKVDMLEVYFKANRNSENACTSYAERFPERQQPHRTIFRRIISNLLNFGSFEQTRANYEVNDADIRRNNILQNVTNNPSTSVRQVARETGIPKSTVHKTLKKNKYYPYKPTIVQGLNDNDHHRRLQFSRWYLQKCEDDAIFPRKILWTDETRFTNCGVFNRHNYHHWSTENPHLVNQRRFQVRFGFNLWCGLIDNHLIGPFIFDYNLTGNRYLELLTNEIMPALRQIINPDNMQNIWYQQDGCPAHNTRDVQHFLRENFNERVLSNNGPVQWPARSPDLTPLDFYLWGTTKNDVFNFEPPETGEILEQRVLDVLRSLNGNTLRRVCNSVRIRCQKCVEQNGRHIEQFL